MMIMDLMMKFYKIGYIITERLLFRRFTPLHRLVPIGNIIRG